MFSPLRFQINVWQLILIQISCYDILFLESTYNAALNKQGCDSPSYISKTVEDVVVQANRDLPSTTHSIKRMLFKYKQKTIITDMFLYHYIYIFA